MPTFTIDSFKDMLNRKGGIARPQFFLIEIPRLETEGGSESLTALSRATSLPGRSLENIPIPIHGMNLNVADNADYDPWTVTMMATNHMAVYKACYEWQRQAFDPHTQTAGLPSQYKVDGADSIKISLLAPNNQGHMPVYTTILRGAYPLTLAPLEVGHEANAPITFDITFQYDYWEPTYFDTGSFSAIAMNAADIAQRVNSTIQLVTSFF